MSPGIHSIFWSSHVRLTAFVVAMLSGPAAYSRTVEPAPDITTWIAEVRDANFSLQTVPQRVLLLESKLNDANARNFISDATAMEKISPFFFVDTPSFTLSSKLNRDLNRAGTKGEKRDPAAETSANVVITEVKSKAPVLFVNDGKRIRSLGKIKPFKGDGAPEAILTWIYEGLGYDGVILAKKGSHVLVAGPASVLGREKIQALAIRGSEAQLALLDKKRSGSSLLELESSKGPYAIFKILALAKDATDLPVGIKLTIQREGSAK